MSTLTALTDDDILYAHGHVFAVLMVLMTCDALVYMHRAKSASAKTGKPEPASDVQAAIEAVDKAVELLPEESGISFSVYEQQEGAGWNQRGNDAPAQNPGSKVGLHVAKMSQSYARWRSQHGKNTVS